jgi:hypothetical protein
MISPEAVEAALDAYYLKSDHHGLPEECMQAALAAAFPIMLREVAQLNWLTNDAREQIKALSESFSEGDG